MPTNNSINTGKPIEVSNGGTTNTTFTAYSVLTAGTTATGAFQNVSGLGTASQVLTSAGAAALPTWSNAPPIRRIQSQTANNSASLAFTTGIAAPYNNFILVINNYLPVTNATSLFLQISTNGGASYINTNYECALIYGQAATGYATNVNTTTEFILMRTVDNATQTSMGVYYLYDFTNGSLPCINGNSTFSISGVPEGGSSFGFNTANTTVNAFQIISSSGNLSQGNFTLYGILE